MNRVLKMLIVVVPATAWLFVGPEILQAQGVSNRFADLLAFTPSIFAISWVTSWNRDFMACEYRAWKHLLNRH